MAPVACGSDIDLSSRLLRTDGLRQVRGFLRRYIRKNARSCNFRRGVDMEQPHCTLGLWMLPFASSVERPNWGMFVDSPLLILMILQVAICSSYRTIVRMGKQLIMPDVQATGASRGRLSDKQRIFRLSQLSANYVTITKTLIKN